MIRLAILAANPTIRAGLSALLGGEEDMEVLREAPGPEALDEQIDVLVVAADPGLAALDSLARLPPLLLLSEDPAAAWDLADLPIRAWGLLPPEAGAEELAAAVRALHSGLLAASAPLLGPLLRPRPLLPVSGRVGTVKGSSPAPLSPRETEVLGLLAQGLGNKQIAASLALSEHTVKFHTSAIYAKLGVTNRTEAVRRGIERGLLTL